MEYHCIFPSFPFTQREDVNKQKEAHFILCQMCYCQTGFLLSYVELSWSTKKCMENPPAASDGEPHAGAGS